MAKKGDHMMRAKVMVNEITHYPYAAQKFVAQPVVKDEKFGPNGESENNTYSRYSPAGRFELTITNPELFGKLKPNQVMYVDFILAEDDGSE